MKKASFEREQLAELQRTVRQQNAFVRRDYEGPEDVRPARLKKRSRQLEPQGDLVVNGQTVHEHKNYRNQYRADDVRKTKLPMWHKGVFGFDGCRERVRAYQDRCSGEVRARYPGQSRSERQRLKQPVKPGEEVIGWLQVPRGYVPLFREADRKEIDKKKAPAGMAGVAGR